MADNGDIKNGYEWVEGIEGVKPGWYSEADLSYGGDGEEPVAAQGAESTDTDQTDATLTGQALYEREMPGAAPWSDLTEEDHLVWTKFAIAERKAEANAKAVSDKSKGGFASANDARRWAYEHGLFDFDTETVKGYDIVINPATNRFELRSNVAAQAKAEAEKAKAPTIQRQLDDAYNRGKESGDFAEYQNLLKASKPLVAPDEPTGDQPIFWTDPATGQQYFKSSETDDWQKGAAPPAPAKTPTVDDLIMEAILSGNSEAAMALWDFANMPSQAERLKLAIAASQSPADYLATVGMMRGEIPIGPSASPTRLGPESQAFAAYGVGGATTGGGSQNPLQDPALQRFIASRGGGAGVQTTAPGGGAALPGAAPGPYQPGEGQGPYGIAPSTQPVSLGQGPRLGEKPAFGADSQAMDRYQASLDTQRLGTQTAQPLSSATAGSGSYLRQAFGEDILAGRALTQRLSYPELGERQGVGSPTDSGYRVGATGKVITKEELAKLQASNNGQGLQQMLDNGAVKDVRTDKSPDTFGRDWMAKSGTDWAGLQARIQAAADAGRTDEVKSLMASAQSERNRFEADRTAYLSTKNQGVPIPRFRSAQARSMQTSLERRLFEAGLQQQGVDVPTYLAQEEAGTTPGGSRRRRVMTGY